MADIELILLGTFMILAGFFMMIFMTRLGGLGIVLFMLGGLFVSIIGGLILASTFLTDNKKKRR